MTARPDDLLRHNGPPLAGRRGTPRIRRVKHPCGCHRDDSTITERAPALRGLGAPTLIRHRLFGEHDPNGVHPARHGVRALPTDTYPGRP